MKLLLILLVALMFEATGVVLLSKGLRQIAPQKVSWTEIKRVASRAVTNPALLLGVLCEAIFFAGLLMLLSKGDVSLIWPLTSLGFVLTTLAAKFFLHEHVSSLRWTGVFFIMIGAALITWSEHRDTSSKDAIATVQQP